MTQAPTAPTTQTAANTVKVDAAGPARKRLTITIPAEVVDSRLQASMATLSNQTVVPGFRKGHVPAKILEKRFGTSIRAETKNQLVASAYAEAIEQHKIKPVGEPEPGEGLTDTQLEQGKPFEFSIYVEVTPTFDMPKFDGIEVKKPMLEITPKMVEDELKRLAIAYGTPNEVSDGFEEGDRIGGYAAVTKNDEAEPFFRTDEAGILMPGKDDGGRGQVLGLLIDGLHGILKNKKVGESFTVEATGPDVHEREDLRGAKIRIVFEIRAAQRVTPATTEQIATQFGLPSEAVLKEQVKYALEHRRDEEQATAMRDQVIDQLADMVTMELPENLSAQQATRQLEQIRLDLLSRGIQETEVEEKLAEVRGQSEDAAREQLKRFFLMHQLGEHFGIEVSEQEVNGRIASIAAQRNIRPEKLRNELAQSGRLSEVARLIRDQKAADRVVQQVKKTEISADEWNKVYKDKQKAGSSKASTAKDKKPAAKPAAKAAASDDDSAKKKTSKKK